jgi:hypothetical protein
LSGPALCALIGQELNDFVTNFIHTGAKVLTVEPTNKSVMGISGDSSLSAHNYPFWSRASNEKHPLSPKSSPNLVALGSRSLLSGRAYHTGICATII